MNKENLRVFPKTELVGLDIKIVEAANKNQLGIVGKIIDESKNTITIITKDKEKKIIKDQVSFEVEFKGKKIKVKGAKLTKRPEERIKN